MTQPTATGRLILWGGTSMIVASIMATSPEWLLPNFEKEYGTAAAPRIVEVAGWFTIAALFLLPAVGRWLNVRRVVSGFGVMGVAYASMTLLGSVPAAVVALGTVGIVNIGLSYLYAAVPARAGVPGEYGRNFMGARLTISLPVAASLVTWFANSFELKAGLAAYSVVMFLAFALGWRLFRDIEAPEGPPIGGFKQAWTRRARRVGLLAALNKLPMGMHLLPVTAIIQRAGFVSIKDGERLADPRWVLAVTATAIPAGFLMQHLFTRRSGRSVDLGVRAGSALNVAGALVLLPTAFVHGPAWMTLELVGMMVLFLAAVTEQISYSLLGDNPGLQGTVVNFFVAVGFVGGGALANVAIFNLGIPHAPLALASAIVALGVTLVWSRPLRRRTAVDATTTPAAIEGQLALAFALLDPAPGQPSHGPRELIPCVLVSDESGSVVLDWRDLEIEVTDSRGELLGTVGDVTQGWFDVVRTPSEGTRSPYGRGSKHRRGPQCLPGHWIDARPAPGASVDIAASDYGPVVTFPEADSHRDGTRRVAAAWTASRPLQAREGIVTALQRAAVTVQRGAAMLAARIARWLSHDRRLDGNGSDPRVDALVTLVAAVLSWWFGSWTLAALAVVGLSWLGCAAIVHIRNSYVGPDVAKRLFLEAGVWRAGSFPAGLLAGGCAAALILADARPSRIDAAIGLGVAGLLWRGLAQRFRRSRNSYWTVERARRTAWTGLAAQGGAVSEAPLILADRSDVLRVIVASVATSTQGATFERDVEAAVERLLPMGHSADVEVVQPDPDSGAGGRPAVLQRGAGRRA